MNHRKIISGIDKNFVSSGSVTQEDIDQVRERSQDIKYMVESGGPLKRFADDVRLLLMMVHDYFSGRYREVPYGSIAAIIFALAYVLSPVDLIPDFIPVVGLLDDAAVLAACIALVREDVQIYRQWRVGRQAIA